MAIIPELQSVCDVADWRENFYLQDTAASNGALSACKTMERTCWFQWNVNILLVSAS